jgi:nitroreductase/dihydropteridine reductase
MNKIIESLNWRYAVKSFDTTKKVNEEDLNTIIEAFRLTPSSFWLEPWKLIVVENIELKNSLVEHSYGQKQVWEASHVLVFTRKTNINNELVDSYLDNMCSINGATRENLKWYEDVIKWFISNTDDNWKKSWAEQQVYLALWNVMTVLAEMKIDSCAIWWFNPKWYDELLNLEEQGLASVVVLPIWYRNKDDKYLSANKVRFSTEEISEIIK